jgi:hypothetical protein
MTGSAYREEKISELGNLRLKIGKKYQISDKKCRISKEIISA